MAYINKFAFAGNIVFCSKYHSWRYKSEKRFRRENYKATTKQQEAINQRQAAERDLRYSIENFNKGDKFIRLSYTKNNYPLSFDKADKILTSFLKKLKRKYKDLYYTANTELGTRGGLHHHLLIPKDFDLNIIIDMWIKHCGGGFHIKDIYSGDIVQLASYFTKGSIDEQISGGNENLYADLQREHAKIKKMKIHKSRNLKKPPEPIKKKVRADSWREEPRTQVIGDYIYDVKPGSVITGFTQDGYPYQSYILIRRGLRRTDNGRREMTCQRRI